VKEDLAMHRTATHRVPRIPRALGVLLVLLLACVLVPTAASVDPAAAVDGRAVPGSWAVPGTVRTGIWTVASTTSATAPFPGNGAQVAPLRADLTEPGNLSFASTGTPTLEVVARSTTTSGTGCVAGADLGELRHCGRLGTVTLTFPRPVTDPVVKVALGSGALESPAGCVESWPTARITRVDGQPTGDAASIVPDVVPPHTWDPAASWLMPDVASLLPKARCTTDIVDYTPVAVSGLVSSIELDVYFTAAIVRGDERMRDAAVPGSLKFAPSVPVADLQVATDAVGTVGPGEQITWDVAVRNNGTGGSHGFTVQDVVPAEITDPAVVTAPGSCELVGSDLVCVNPPPRCSVTQNALVTTLLDLACPTSRRDASAVVLGAGDSFGTITLTGTAPTGRGTVVTNTARVAGADFDLDGTNNAASVDTEVVAPTLSVGKRLDSRIAEQDQFTVSAAAGGSAVTSVTTTGAEQAATSPAVQVGRGTAYTITESMAAGSVSSLARYGGQLRCTDDTGAEVAATGSAPTWTFTPAEDRAYTCLVTNEALDRSFVVQKTASVATAQAGGTVRYEITLTSTGRAAYTTEDPATLVDDLTEVLDDASLEGDVDGGAVVDGSTLRWSGALPVGGTATIGYTVRVHDTFTGDRSMVNVVTTPPGSGGSCPPGAEPADGCSTTTPVEGVTATVLVEKVGDGPGGQPVRQSGARFEVLADEAGSPGAALTGAGGAETQTGLVEFELLAPGTYWLREVAAPQSFVLLAEPVRFTVTASGVVALTDPADHPQVSVTGAGTLTVHDVAGFSLPSAGSTGTSLLLLTGGTLLVLAVSTGAVRARRSRTPQPIHLTKENNA
jgi:uncharacterized repeat protein (TIGR01451 family)